VGQRVLRIFGPKKEDVTGGWIKLYNEEDEKRTAHVAQEGEKRNTYKILVGNPEGRRPAYMGG
jgi:hypothetical protein